MPWPISTPSEIAARLRAGFDGALNGALARLWPNNVSVSAKVFGGGLSEVYDYQAWIKDQIFTRTCADEVLEDHGADLDLPIREATAATGLVVGTVSAAIAVSAGTIVTRGDGRSYSVVADIGTSGPGDIAIQVMAVEPGAGGVALPGTVMTIAGVDGAVVDGAGLTGGADRESYDSYRERLLFFKAYRPGHARPSDYVIWASEVSGVSRVFVERRPYGPGTVRVFPLFDGIYEDGIPPAGEIARVQSYLDVVGASGVADIIVAAPVAQPIPVEIDELKPNLIGVRNVIRDEIRATVRRRGVVAGSDTPHPAMPFLATPQSFSRSWIGQAISNAAGEDRHDLILPASNVTVSAGSIATYSDPVFS
ncbi:MAG: baseplate J/gp47 family protein [Bosea sp.]|uniref:baseplate J/gp47 family protein n=1 Tax=unclassified Bosea (in: a-proteobacteria) TaxID=2653178 RepID=UPI0009670600|nr:MULTISPECIES: baseplate J/gp47 family protein [unclassified Bosea (in: a-proteobacteria)]MBN9459066.1 baseplate J/gp47 family protein [Bosea sp. (in: a-proteobacteria)]OJV06195.1 MAG: hypothetical protein BGO20_08025 [Bosea sp. 67-29]